MADASRLDNLRRRVQADPASIAFAQLAEECRRAGNPREAVDVCRAGLAIHPEYPSARATLGRALIELDRLDEAETELSQVLQSAPDNLAAIRGLALINRRRGNLEPALAFYRTALELAPRTPDLERSVAELSRQIEARQAESRRSPPPALVPVEPRPDVAGHSGQGEAAAPPLAAASAGETLTTSPDDRGHRTLAALEQWLAAVHVARASRRP